MSEMAWEPTPAWMTEALCRGIDADLWFPEPGASCASAKAICRECPAASDCLEYAMEHNIVFGIWGGQSAKDRKALRRTRPGFVPRPARRAATGVAS